jgi:superfamily II DNA helicase RecQ
VLKNIYSAKAQFYGLQKPILKAIIQNKSPVLIVIRTNVEKTLLFQILVISMGFDTTVIITLLVLLQDYIVQRYRTVRILCVK